MTGTETKNVRVGQGDVCLGQYIRNMGINSPFGAAYALRDA
jgi:hypothetical protein